MSDLQKDFIRKASYIIKDKNKLEELKIIGNDLILKCAESFKVEEGILVLDENLNITDCDEIFGKWFNIEKDFLLGKNIKAFFPKEFKDIIETFFKKLNKRKSYKQKEIIFKIKDKEKIFEIKGKIFHFNKKNCIILTFSNRVIETNIYKLKKIEDEIANLLIRIRDFEILMKEVLKIFVNSGLFDLGWVAKIDKELKKIVPIITLNEEKEDVEFKQKVFDYNYFHNVLDMLIKKEEIVVDNVEFEGKKYKKAIVFPIFNKWEFSKDNEIEYAVLVYSEKEINFNDEEILLLKEIIYKLNISIADIFIKNQTSLLLSTCLLYTSPSPRD
jgi:hypothetical protein